MTEIDDRDRRIASARRKRKTRAVIETIRTHLRTCDGLLRDWDPGHVGTAGPEWQIADELFRVAVVAEAGLDAVLEGVEE